MGNTLLGSGSRSLVMQCTLDRQIFCLFEIHMLRLLVSSHGRATIGRNATTALARLRGHWYFPRARPPRRTLCHHTSCFHKHVPVVDIFLHQREDRVLQVLVTEIAAKIGVEGFCGSYIVTSLVAVECAFELDVVPERVRPHIDVDLDATYRSTCKAQRTHGRLALL